MQNKSVSDLRKENHEQEVLETAIQLSKTKRKITRDILSMMDGNYVERGKNDKPDIVKMFHIEHGKKICEGIIGIEHFLAEQVSVVKKGKRISFIKEYDNQLAQILENKEIIMSDSKQMQTAKEKIINTVFDIGAQTNKSGIPDLKESFCAAYKSHLEKIGEYRKNLSIVANGQQIKLAFLIEVSCHADDVFLNNGRTVVRRHNDIYPLFMWMVEELEKTSPGLLDYCILYIRNPVEKNKEDVIAIDMNDIQGSLRKQQILVYEYCNDPSNLDFIKQEVPGEGFRYYPTVKNTDTFGRDILPSLIQAVEYKKKSIPYVAPRIVQGMVCALGKELIEKLRKGEILPGEYNTAEILQKYDQFGKENPITNTENEEQAETSL